MRRLLRCIRCQAEWLLAYLNECAWRYNHRAHDQFRALLRPRGSAGLENRQLVDQHADPAVWRVGVKPTGEADQRALV